MISGRTIVRGALTRTFPAALLALAPLVGLALVAGTPLTMARLVLPLTGSLAVAAGSAAALLAFRRRLHPDAGVGGRRAFIVGLGAMAVGLTVRARANSQTQIDFDAVDAINSAELSPLHEIETPEPLGSRPSDK